MPWSERSGRYHKQQTDCAIRHAHARLAADASTLQTFRELLHYVRKGAARLLEAPVLNEHHPGVQALVNLSLFGHALIRPAAEWPGTTSSWRVAVASLAHHLLCRYKVPMFLAACWYSTEDALGDKKREWFVAHGRGARFRSLDLPIAMTRKMEHIFLGSHDHLPIEYAMRRAELLALDTPAQFVQAVLSTGLVRDLSNGMFWRTVWRFLIANAPDIDPVQIGPMIDFIQAIRHEPAAVRTQNGIVQFRAPQPNFSMKGRTVQSVLRLMHDWHRSLASGSNGPAWTPSRLQPLLVQDLSEDTSVPPKIWQLVELTNRGELQREGAALHHCVASYAGRCCSGLSRIWSLRSSRGEKVRHVLTIEVDPRRRAVVQARGLANRAASGKPLRLLQEWAAREKLQLAL